MPPRSLKKLFIEYLMNEKSVSDNTLQAYISDINLFYEYAQNDNGVVSMTAADIDDFKNSLKRVGRATSSVSRVLSSVRAYYAFLLRSGFVSHNPAKLVKNDKLEKTSLEYLTYDEVDRLIGAPSGNDDKSVRDRVILELIYATGMKVSELISLEVTDFNNSLSFVTCGSSFGKKRNIPLYPKIKKMLTKYISNVRPFLVTDSSENALFVNINGHKMTRQGLWKIIKSYAEIAGIEKDITPKALRHSFAMHLLENGADIKQLRDILGHSDISTTNIYVDTLKKNTCGPLISLHPHA